MALKKIRNLQQIIASSKENKKNLCSVLDILTLLQAGAKPSILNKPEDKDYLHVVTYKGRVYAAKSLNLVQTIQQVYHPKREYLDGSQ